MPRTTADIHISLKRCGGPTQRIALVRQAVGKRYRIRRDGKLSTKVPEATASQITEAPPADAPTDLQVPSLVRRRGIPFSTGGSVLTTHTPGLMAVQLARSLRTPQLRVFQDSHLLGPGEFLVQVARVIVFGWAPA